MTAILLTALALTGWDEPTAEKWVSGQATYYADGVMAQVAANRDLVPEPSMYQGGCVALNSAGDLFREVWLVGPLGIEGPYRVCDCAQRNHYEQRLEQGRIVEVDWPTAKRWEMRGPVPVVVLFEPPWEVYNNGNGFRK